MATKLIKIGNKKVLLSEPYECNNIIQELKGREEELKLILAAWLKGEKSLPLSPLLVGLPGVGKNRLIYELAKITCRPLYIFQGHEDVTAEDLACTVRFSDDDKGKMEYIASPIVTAMIEGGICFIDEIGKIRPRALALLVSVLDDRRYIDSNLLGERVFASPGFRFIAATNTGEINFLPEFIQSRMRPVIKIGDLSQEEINEIIMEKHFNSKQTVEQINDLLKTFWVLWKDYNDKKSENDKRNATPRDAIYLFALASSLSDYELRPPEKKEKLETDKLGEKHSELFKFDIDLINFSSVITSQNIIDAFDELFGHKIE
jgi:MoxR-like ATPase